MRKLVRFFLVITIFVSSFLPVSATNEKGSKVSSLNFPITGYTSDNIEEGKVSSTFHLTQDLDMFVNGGIHPNNFTDDYLIAMKMAETVTFGNDEVVTFTRSGQNLENYINAKHIHFDKIDMTSVTVTSHLFSNMTNLKTIDFGDNFDTSSVISMNSMFYNTTNLESLTLPPTFDTSNVTDMSKMFQGSSKLLLLDLGPSFNTHKVTSMGHMFSSVSALTTLDLGSSFDTTNVRDMQRMFQGMGSLRELDLGKKFNTSNVTNMLAMFASMTSLIKLNLGDNFNTSKVINMSEMFYGLSKIEDIDLGKKFYTSNAQDMRSMFAALHNIKHLDLSNFEINTDKTDQMLLDSKVHSISLGPGVKSIHNFSLKHVLTNRPEFTGGWYLLENPKIRYSTSKHFTNSYDGTNSEHIGTYIVEPRKYEVIYESPDNKENFPLTDGFYPYGSKYTVQFDKIPKIEGQTFVGWYDKVSDQLFTPENNILEIGAYNVILTATYENKTYDVKFVDDGTILSTVSVKYNELIPSKDIPDEPIKKGHTFLHWNDKADGTGNAFEFDSDVVIEDMALHAIYQKDSYTVSFWNDSLHVKDAVALYDELLDISDLPGDITLIGHTFLGWNTEEDGSGVLFDYSKDKIMSDLKLYSSYSVNSYRVVFLDHEDEVLEVLDIPYGNEFSLIDTPFVEGHTATWKHEDNHYEANTKFIMEDDHITFKLVYKQDDVTDAIDPGEGIEPEDKPIVEEKPKPEDQPNPEEKPTVDDKPNIENPDENNGLPSTGLASNYNGYILIALGAVLVILRKKYIKI